MYMYYEEAEVREYYRKNSEGVKKPFYQINLKKSSKFNEPKSIALVDISEIEALTNNIDESKISEIEVELNKLKSSKQEVDEKLIQYNELNEELTSENATLKEEISKLQSELLKAESKNEEIIQLQKDHKKDLDSKNEEIKDLNSKLLKEKDLTKSLLVVRNDLLTRGLLSRIRNKEPDSSKLIGEIKPVELDTKSTSKNK